MILIGVFIGMSGNSKATMIVTDPGISNHTGQYSDRGLKGKLHVQQPVQEIGMAENLSTAGGSVSAKGWTRYILVAVMFIILIRFWIAGMARKKANRITKYLVLHAMHFKLDYQLASLIYQRNYLDEVGPKQILFLFSYKQLINKDDLEMYRNIQYDINQSSMKNHFDRTNWKDIRNSLHLQCI
jgi:hypothetical protein